MLPQLLYKLEAYRYQGSLIYTNNIPYYFHHGGGMSPEQFALGQHLYQLSRDIGMDPVEFQLKNAVDKGYTTLSGTHYASCGLKECFTKVAKKVEIERRIDLLIRDV